MDLERENAPVDGVATVGGHRHDVADVPHFVFHRGRVLFLWLLAQTAVFPIEHYLWEKAPGLRSITHWLGL